MLPPELNTPEGRAALLAKAAPDTESEAAVRKRLSGAVVVNGGARAVREALAARRARGPNKAPTKVPLTLRVPPDALDRWKATGPGWQTRMADAIERLSKRL